MGDYLKKSQFDLSGKKKKDDKTNQVIMPLDNNALNTVAQIVINAIKSDISNIKVQNIVANDEKKGDNFDDSRSLSKLADSMIMQRNKNESNFNELGNVNKSKKKDADSTIDILSKLD